MPEPIDLVYPLGPGSVDANFEILHSLMLVKKHMTGYRNIYVIGEVPPAECFNLFIDDPAHKVYHVYEDNKGHNRQDAIRRKLILACQLEFLSDPFLAMNDDYFLRGPLHAPTYPYYYNSNIVVAYNSKRKQGHYKRALLNTIMALAKNNLLAYYFDIHVPIRYSKVAFLSVMTDFDFRIRDSYVIKSLYGNSLDLYEPEAGGCPLPDCNINHYTSTFNEIESFIIPSDRNIFAVGENGLNDNMKNYIKSLL